MPISTVWKFKTTRAAVKPPRRGCRFILPSIRAKRTVGEANMLTAGDLLSQSLFATHIATAYLKGMPGESLFFHLITKLSTLASLHATGHLTGFRVKWDKNRAFWQELQMVLTLQKDVYIGRTLFPTINYWGVFPPKVKKLTAAAKNGSIF